MKGIIEASELPVETKVYLKNDFMGWQVIEPWKDPETGKINWFNLIFGGTKGLWMLMLIIIIAGCFWFGVNELIGNYKAIAANPCQFCSDCASAFKNAYANYSSLNLSLT